MIDVRLEHTPIAIGDTLSGKIVLHSSHKKVPKRVSISICWHTKGWGARDRKLVQELSLDHENLVSLRGTIPFSLNIPHDGPISYNSSLICIIWEFQIFVDMPGLFARDEKRILPFQVIPRQSR